MNSVQWRGNSNFNCSAIIIQDQGTIWHGGQEGPTVWKQECQVQNDSLWGREVSLPEEVRNAAALPGTKGSWNASAQEPLVVNRLGDEPNTQLRNLMLTLTGSVSGQVYRRHQLMSHLGGLLVEPLMAVGLCPLHFFVNSLYLSTNACLIWLKGYNKNSPISVQQMSSKANKSPFCFLA